MTDKRHIPVEVHIRLIGKELIKKLGLETIVSAEQLDECTRATVAALNGGYSITDFDPKKGWHKILAAREFLRMLGGEILIEKIDALDKGVYSTPEFARLRKNLDKLWTFGAKSQELPSIHTALDPCSWDLPPLESDTNTEEFKLARLVFLGMGLHFQQQAIEAYGETLENVIKVAAQTRARDRKRRDPPQL